MTTAPPSAGSVDPASALRPPAPAAPLRIYGVVHLLPLPGGPCPSPGLPAVLARAAHDAEALFQGGAHGVVVENFGDAPFPAGRSDPHVVAMMTRAAAEVQAHAPGLQLGINVLRNDAFAALGIAAAVGADFVRVNVLSGASWTDQGLIEGQAHALLCYRRRLGCEPGSDHPVEIFADVLVKHGVPAGESDPQRAAEEAAKRAGADALIVTGAGTGQPTDLGVLTAAVRGAGGVPVLVGSGVEPTRIAAFHEAGARGVIVGTFLHEDADIRRPLDRARIELVCATAKRGRTARLK